MLTVKEVARRLQISSGAVYKAIGNGRLSHYRIGAAIRVSESQLAEFLDESCMEKPCDTASVKDLISTHLGPWRD